MNYAAQWLQVDFFSIVSGFDNYVEASADESPSRILLCKFLNNLTSPGDGEDEFSESIHRTSATNNSRRSAIQHVFAKAANGLKLLHHCLVWRRATDFHEYKSFHPFDLLRFVQLKARVRSRRDLLVFLDKNVQRLARADLVVYLRRCFEQ